MTHRNGFLHTTLNDNDAAAAAAADDDDEYRVYIHCVRKKVNPTQCTTEM